MSASPCPERGIIILSTVSCYQTKVSSNSGQSLSHSDAPSSLGSVQILTDIYNMLFF